MSRNNNNLQQWQDGAQGDLAGWLSPGDKQVPGVHFLHGNGFCARTLWPMAQEINCTGDMWFTDVPGHGISVQPDHDMPDWLKMARRVGDGLERNAGGKPVVGIGHSMGGVITLMLAAERPQLFSRIILLDPVLFSPEILLVQRLVRKTGMWKRTALVKAVAGRRQQWPDVVSMKEDLQKKSLYRKWVPDALDEFITGASRAAADGVELSCSPHWEASIFGSYPRGLWQAVHRVTVPVDILVATESYGFIARSARKAAKANANIRWQTVAGSHCFPMEQPRMAAELINRILSNDPH